MSAWTVVLVAGLASYLLRMSMIGSDRFRLPARLDNSVAMVAPAAFAAMAITSLAGLALAPGWSGRSATVAAPVILAAVVAGCAVARTGRPFLAVATGMPTFWLATALLSL